MAQPIITIRNIATICLLAMAASVSAEVLVDPTRPPTAFIPARALVAGETAGPVLQSVLMSRGRRIAIISGKEVRENDRFGGARVVKISDTEVVLRSGRQVQTLKLFPDVYKQTVQRVKRKTADVRGEKRRGKE